MRQSLALLLSILLAAACASGYQGGQPLAGRDVITAAQIEAEGNLQSATAYEVVQRFHAEWLLGSPATSPTDPPRLFPVVYVDDIRLGEADTLRNVPGGDIAEIRFLDRRDADFRYGTGHRGGVIAVRTKSGRR
jgi:hypothetical protein